MPLQIKPSSGSGSITLQATTGTTTNDTLTLPAKTGNIITSADSGTVTQTMLGTNVAGNGPAFLAKMSANQTLSQNTNTKVILDTKTYDTASCFDSTTNYRFTPNVAGYYSVGGVIQFQGTAARQYAFVPYVYKNGSSFANASCSLALGTGGDYCVFINTLVYLNGSTDYIEMYAYEYDYTSAASVTINKAATAFFGCLTRAG